MASSGQILSILGALEKGAGKVQRGERRARREEGKQHRKLSQETAVRGAKASREGKKGEKWGSILSTLAALSGAGIPLMVAAQFAGSLAGGTLGAMKGRKGVNLEGLAGTKFGTELGEVKKSLGSDVFGNAMNRALVTLATAGMSKGLGSFFKKGAFGLDKLKMKGEPFKQLFGKKSADLSGDIVTSLQKDITTKGMHEAGSKAVSSGLYGGKTPESIFFKGLGEGSQQDIIKQIARTDRLYREQFPWKAGLGKVGITPREIVASQMPGSSGLQDEALATLIEGGGGDAAAKEILQKELADSELGKKLLEQGISKTGKGIPNPLKALHEATGKGHKVFDYFGKMGEGESALTRLLSSYMTEDKLQKMPSTFDYELPSSLAQPESQRGFGGYV